MMNNQARIDPELHAFVKQDRIRLFTERNEFKALAENFERDLYNTKYRSRNVIGILMFIIVVLIGVIAYVSKFS